MNLNKEETKIYNRRKRNACVNIFLDGVFTLSWDLIKNAKRMGILLAKLSMDKSHENNF